MIMISFWIDQVKVIYLNYSVINYKVQPIYPILGCAVEVNCQGYNFGKISESWDLGPLHSLSSGAALVEVTPDRSIHYASKT